MHLKADARMFLGKSGGFNDMNEDYIVDVFNELV